MAEVSLTGGSVFSYVWLALLFSAVLVAAGLALARRLTRYAVAGPSMEPALHDGDWLIVDRQAFRRRPPRLGEVVVFRDPPGAPRESVKRVTGQTDPGWYLVEGDNPDHSIDSRQFGPVGRDAILGRAVARYWPSPRRL